MKNKLTDLNDHLFAQLERLGEEGIDESKIEMEAKRAEAMVQVADQIIRNADLQLKAVTVLERTGDRFAKPLAPMIGRTAE
ncbi:hypothetical protein C7W88_13060 [Novosphingobium sp. THN1]|uniref:hypothetical protein n=1 Tax=Novosphingobium sp. THN1 TaxID=1016987 RepID=UPI000E4B5BB7|nr:hypothetical protein [Novosphingobium sp. THN1]AXU19751.1 hypothetical protein C7W88_13060 [Novosphingobium sp. THN1]